MSITGKFKTRNKTALYHLCDVLLKTKIAKSAVTMVNFGSPKYSLRLLKL